MKKTIIIAAVAVVAIIVIAGAYLGYSGLVAPPEPTPAPSPPPEVATQEAVRDAAMQKIASDHSDLKDLTENLQWTGGRQETGVVGSDTYIYIAGNWNVTITNPVVLDPVYAISAIYTDTESAVTIEWEGTYQDEVITETGFNYVVP